MKYVAHGANPEFEGNLFQQQRDNIIGRARRIWRSWKKDALLRRLLGNASMLLGGKAATALFSLGYLALAARGLSLEAFGTLILIHTYTQAVGDISKFQSWQALLTYGTPFWQTGRIRELQQVLRFTVRLDIIGSMAALAIAMLGIPVAGHFFGWPPETASCARYYVLSVILLDVGTATGVMRLFDRFDLVAPQSSLGALIRLAGAGIAYYLGAGLDAYLLVWGLAIVIPALVLIAMSLRELRRHGVLRASSGTAQETSSLWSPDRKVWNFVWSTNFNTSLQLAFSHFGTLAVGAFLGAGAAALYRVARQLSEAITAPVKLLTPTIYPELARLSANKAIREMRRFMLRASLLAGLGASALVALLIFAGPWVLTVIAGANFTAAYGVMVALGVAAALRLWAFPLEPMLISSGMAVQALRIRLAATLIYGALMFLLCPAYGLVGAGVALLLASMVNLAGQLFVTEKLLRSRAPTA